MNLHFELKTERNFIRNSAQMSYQTRFITIQTKCKRLPEVYSSTKLTPFAEGHKSILNWVLKHNPLNQKIKK